MGALSACFFMCMSIITKLLYNIYPSVGVYAILLFRSLGVLVVILPHILWKHSKERDKHNLILSWTSHNKVKWAIAIGHILIVSTLVQITLHTFYVSLVTIFLNTGPTLTVFLCALFVKSERVTINIVLRVLFAFAGVLCITLGSPPVSESSSKMVVEWYHYLCLVLMPLFIAVGNTIMGEFHSLDPLLIPFYSNVLTAVISFFICCFGEKGFVPSDQDLEE